MTALLQAHQAWMQYHSAIKRAFDDFGRDFYGEELRLLEGPTSGQKPTLSPWTR